MMDATITRLQQKSVVTQVPKKKSYFMAKRCLDVMASGSVLLVLLPVFLIIALVVYLDDPAGSPFFYQTRVGRNGKHFRFYKFRTMVVNAEQLLEQLQSQNEKDGPVFKMEHDPRITRVGKFLRKTSLDELPQLWNVFKGDMSLVGPRPALPREVAQYNDYHAQRLTVTPGLTCYWQAKKQRDSIGFEEWMELDIQYIQDSNLKVDLRIIFQTVGVVFTGQGK